MRPNVALPYFITAIPMPLNLKISFYGIKIITIILKYYKWLWQYWLTCARKHPVPNRIYIVLPFGALNEGFALVNIQSQAIFTHDAARFNYVTLLNKATQ